MGNGILDYQTRRFDQTQLQVSVIIPTYNRASYLSLALDSVFSQTLGPFEVIVIDDGSTDGTKELIEEGYPSVRYLHQDHLGIPSARNMGLKEAKGNIIAWLDSDDLWMPQFLECTISALRNNNKLAGIYTGFIHIDPLGIELEQSSSITESPENLYCSLIEAPFIATPTIVVRKCCYEDVGFFDTTLSMAEDFDMWLRLAQKYYIVGVPQPLAAIRVHSRNTIQNSKALAMAILSVGNKHIADSGHPDANHSEMRNKEMAFFHRLAGMAFLQGGLTDEAWHQIQEAALLWAPILQRIDTYYELIWEDTPRGYRGNAKSLDISRKANQLFTRLEDVFINTHAMKKERQQALAYAFWTLGIISDQAGDWRLAKRYLQEAVKYKPALLISYPMFRRMAKLYAGKRIHRILVNSGAS